MDTYNQLCIITSYHERKHNKTRWYGAYRWEGMRWSVACKEKLPVSAIMQYNAQLERRGGLLKKRSLTGGEVDRIMSEEQFIEGCQVGF